MLKIKLCQRVSATPAEVRKLLLDHANLGCFFSAKCELVAGQNSPELDGGVGTIRRVTMRGSNFLEQVVVADDCHIAYQIIGDGPVTEHRGDIYLARDGLATNIDYLIECKAPWWQPDWLVALVIKKDIGSGLEKIAQYFEHNNGVTQ